MDLLCPCAGAVIYVIHNKGRLRRSNWDGRVLHYGATAGPTDLLCPSVIHNMVRRGWRGNWDSSCGSKGSSHCQSPRCSFTGAHVLKRRKRIRCREALLRLQLLLLFLCVQPAKNASIGLSAPSGSTRVSVIGNRPITCETVFSFGPHSLVAGNSTAAWVKHECTLAQVRTSRRYPVARFENFLS
jgi:hypothetical protein